MAQELDSFPRLSGLLGARQSKDGVQGAVFGLGNYRDRAWTPLANCDNISSSSHPLNTAPLWNRWQTFPAGQQLWE